PPATPERAFARHTSYTALTGRPYADFTDHGPGDPEQDPADRRPRLQRFPHLVLVVCPRTQEPVLGSEGWQAQKPRCANGGSAMKRVTGMRTVGAALLLTAV